jgi:hypothetical protein
MRAGLRLGIAIAAAGLGLSPVPALAQSAPDTTTGTPVTNSIGPRELQNFDLEGTVTRSAEEPPAANESAQPALRAPTGTSGARQPTDRPSATSAPTAQAQAAPETAIETAPVGSSEPVRTRRSNATVAPSSSVTVDLPPLGASPVASSSQSYSPISSTASGFEPEPETPASLASQQSLPLLPWLLAAAALGAGAAFLFWRNRGRHAFAGGHEVDAYVSPQPAPAPRSKPAPAPAPATAPAPAPAPGPAAAVGIVSTRLRPWIELGFKPLRCVLDEAKMTFEFELELFNSGSSTARDVLIEATLFNAGPTQERDIADFFAKPVGQGQRIAAIPPLQRMSLRTEVAAPRSRLQLFEVAGRQVIVPLISFNALYRWSSSEGQTSVSLLLGRETKSEKLAPFRIDLGPRIFRGLGSRPLPQFIRK